MKHLKWLVAIVAVLAIVLVVAHLRRDAIGRDIANAVLKDSGYRVSSASVDDVGVDHVDFSAIVLVGSDGTHVVVRGLSLPLNLPEVRLDRVHASEIIISLAPAPSIREPLSPRIRSLLELSQGPEDFALTAGRVIIDAYPPLDEVAWTMASSRHEMTFRVTDLQLRAELSMLDEGGHRLTVEASHGDKQRALELALELTGEERFSLAGQARGQLFMLQSLLRELGLLPDALKDITADLRGPVTIGIDEPGNGEIVVNGIFTMPDAARIQYEFGEELVLVDVRSEAALDTRYYYPGNTWTARLGDANVTTDRLPAGVQPLGLRDLDCASGVVCQLLLEGKLSAVDVAGVSAGGGSFSAPLEIRIDEQTRIDLARAGAIRLDDLSLPGISARTLAGRVGRGSIAIAGEEVSGEIESVNATVAGLRAQAVPAVPASAPLVLGGSLTVSDEALDGSFTISDRAGSMQASVDVDYALPAGVAHVVVSNGWVDLGQVALRDRFESWPYAWDLLSGRGVIRGRASYDGALRGEFALGVNGLSGTFGNTGFASASTDIDFRIGDTITVEPLALRVALIDVGFPVEDVVVLARPDLLSREVVVEALSFGLFGGKLTARPFTYNVAAARNEVMLDASSLQLPLIVGLLKSDDIETTGTISGTLPVVISGTVVTVSEGRFTADSPGGTIRYKIDPSLIDPDDDSGVTALIRTLALFEYESLVADVNYTEAGDLLLKMTLKGVNPDRDRYQPVVLNLGVENNVPQLLRSLQAVRSIEDILERRSKK